MVVLHYSSKIQLKKMSHLDGAFSVPGVHTSSTLITPLCALSVTFVCVCFEGVSSQSIHLRRNNSDVRSEHRAIECSYICTSVYVFRREIALSLLCARGSREHNAAIYQRTRVHSVTTTVLSEVSVL